MKENPASEGFSAPVALELAKLKTLVESLITVEANQRAIMWGMSHLLHHASEGQFSSAQWQAKLAEKASNEMDGLNAEYVESLSKLAAMLEAAHKPQKN